MGKQADIFAKQIRGAVEQIKDRANAVFGKVVFEILNSVATNTPIDTGRATGNWNVAAGSPEISADFSLNFGGSKGAAMAHVMKKATVSLNRVALGQVVYITNNVDYIVHLNNGTDKMKGAFFVENALVSSLTMLRQEGG